MTPPLAARGRWTQCVLIALTIGLGLASRKFPHLLPAILGKSPGDALWALMMFLIVGLLRPRWPTAAVAAAALAISFLVEFSQLIRASWLTATRQTTFGHLVLGSDFHALDLLAYAIGTALGVLFESARCAAGAHARR